MDAQQDAIGGHLDEVVRQAGLLPTDQRLRVLDAAVSRLQSAAAEAAGDLAVDGTLVGSGCKSAGSWMRLHLRRGVSGYRIARRSQLLPELPGFAAAFAAGQVTDEHVDTVIRWTKPCGLEAIQTHEGTLLQLAQQASAKELEEALEALADLVRPDRDADKIAALADRSFKAAKVGELVHVDAMVEPALGEALKTAVEAGAVLPTGVRRADDGRTLMQRRADAFGELVLRGIGADAVTGAGDRPHTGRLRPQVALTVSTEFLAGLEGAPKPLLDHFGLIPTDTVHRLVCDGELVRVIVDTATGLPLNVGRRHRLAVKRQRRALATVFRHCAFPGCEVPFRFCEIHHRDWWCRDNGETDVDLLLPYCWTHHHFLHEYGFTVIEEHGRLVHRRPDGRRIPDPDQHLRHAITQLKLDWPTAGRAGGYATEIDARARSHRPAWPDPPRPPPLE
ncbi:MAG TPA: DUF222 domain-containing protein [Nocardioidaceae bacterium]|nr:DUF222 domain-containing protein [Nocardioidaceae bacterium]